MKTSVLWQDVVSATGPRTAAFSLALAVVLASIVVAASSAQGQTYKEDVLHNFMGGADGGHPQAGLIFDAKGNLYGTTVYGGAYTYGTVFEVSSKGKETVLHSFKGGADGGNPYAGLIMDAKGNLYGTTLAGGTGGCGSAGGCGTVFKVNSKDEETVLYSFKGDGDGVNPYGGLIFDAKGNLYGTTFSGGAYGYGTVFEVSSKGKETVLYSFTGGTDGGEPVAGLIFDAKGNLYGTTFMGGTPYYGAGTVFELSSKGKETVLHDFTPQTLDGGAPTSGLIFDAKGNLYGTTSTGGSNFQGTVYKVSSKGKETILYSFPGGSDGAGDPVAGLIFDAKGNLYGTACYSTGYGKSKGIVFELSSKGKETVLYSFTGKGGMNPTAGLIFDAKGNLYGTTFAGGTPSYGVVYKLTP